jgi:hypothetical protein
MFKIKRYILPMLDFGHEYGISVIQRVVVIEKRNQAFS